MKILLSVIAVIAIVYAALYFANSSAASTAINCVDIQIGPPSYYVFSASSGTHFDIQLASDANFNYILESLSNQPDAIIFTPNIEVPSSLLHELGSGTYYWKVRVTGGSFVDGNCSFVIP